MKVYTIGDEIKCHLKEDVSTVVYEKDQSADPVKVADP
jgi:hypothetical protein